MEILKLKADFEKLSIPTKIHRISQGKVEHFVYLGTNPMVSNTMVVLCSGDYTDAKCLRYPDTREFKFDDESEFKEVFVKECRRVDDLVFSAVKKQNGSIYTYKW